MSLEPGAAAASSPDDDARYQDFPELRAEHLHLKDSYATVGVDDAAALATRIRQFLKKAQNTGAILMDPSTRRAAQSVLDYWSAELAGLPGAQMQDFVPFMLAPAEISALSTVEQPTVEGAQRKQNKEDQRALIRFSGMARQWRNADKQPDYLLTGEALQQARPFADQDSDLKELVDASDAAEKAREEQEKRRARRRWAAVWTLSIVAAMAGALWYFSALARVGGSLITQGIARGTVDSASALYMLDLIQPFSPPYDLSASQKFTNVHLPRLTLYAPNFSGVEFSGVKFPKAKLPAASFSSSDFSFDGSDPNDFAGAVLQQAQFRSARIAYTSFFGADLYRAVFDRAALCHVNFSQANLRSASFWSVTLDETTTESLQNTAWWQATGWSWSNIQSLATPRAGAPADSVANLKASLGFQADIRGPTERLKAIALSPLERAIALNELAWADAVWGVDTVAPKKDQAAAQNFMAPDACAATGVPANARDAADQAVCIVGKLNREGDAKGTYTDLLSNLRDTLAYIHLQNSDAPDALIQYNLIGNENPQFLNSGEISFRHAVALHADAKNEADRTAAVDKFTDAVDNKRYQPTHELWTLRELITPFKPLTAVLEVSTDKLWPQIQYTKVNQPGPVKPHCPARKSAGSH